MPPRLKIIGNYVSPYVRKVLVFLELKKLDYEIDPIAPFVGDESFTRLSPLRQIPVLIDDGLVLNDSSVICQYLEDKYPAPALYPRDLADRAQARWLEEYCDTQLADGLIWRLFYQLGIKRRLFREEIDPSVVQQALDTSIPAALDYLETQLPDDGFVFDKLSIADISMASFFRTATFVRYAIDTERWPRCAALVARVQDLPVFRKLARFEDAVLRLSLDEQRATLNSLGAPLSRDTYGGAVPRHGFRRAS